MGTGSLPGVKSGRGLTLYPQPLRVPWSRKSRAIPLIPLWSVRPVQSLCALYLFYYCGRTLTLILLTWRMWWAPNNASKWQMGFTLEFKVLISVEKYQLFLNNNKTINLYEVLYICVILRLTYVAHQYRKTHRCVFIASLNIPSYWQRHVQIGSNKEDTFLCCHGNAFNISLVSL